MADLLDRVFGYLALGEGSLAISVHVIVAAMREVNRGDRTLAEITTALALTPADVTGLTTVYAQIFTAGTLSMEEFFDVIALGSTRNRSVQTGAPYYSKATVKTRLGL